MNERIICFHNPGEENGYLSNWYKSSFKEGVTTFNSVEQYMMYKKALTFNDVYMAESILKSDNVANIKEMGRRVAGYDDKVWSAIRYDVVKQALYLKFTQNDKLAEKLKGTGNAILCECAVHDKIWGIGLSMRDPNRLYKSKWKGTNLLGKALMEVRTML